jgi:hypothetical protein
MPLLARVEIIAKVIGPSTTDSQLLYQRAVNLAVYVVFTDGVLIS